MDKKKMPISFNAIEPYTTVIPIQDFIRGTETCMYMDCDGFGYLGKEDENGIIWESSIPVDCYSAWLKQFMEDFTHVCWYGK